MHDLPPTTKSVINSFEHLFTTLHNAIEDQRTEIDEAERRASVLRTLVEIRREARGRWRERREEIDMVVGELTRPAPPPPPPQVMKPEPGWGGDERGNGGYYGAPPPPMGGYREMDPRDRDVDMRRR